MVDKIIAAINPRGICRFGSLSSPESPIPELRPVTAGKNSAKRVQKLASGKSVIKGTRRPPLPPLSVTRQNRYKGQNDDNKHDILRAKC